ncbi:MAG: DnaJ domain-containing protein [Deltaproteobacteria bacterium]|nr:DnaJ domain-containing protein [Deltaproteobacteria bacterium]
MTPPTPIRVLIIDRDNVRRGLLACSLPSSQYRLEFAKTSAQGLDLLGRVHPEVVLVGRDPAMDDLCQSIRSTPAGSRCLLVLMDEAFRDEAAAAHAAEAVGADLALPFPFDLDALDEQLELRRDPRTAQKLPSQPSLEATSAPSTDDPPPPSPEERAAAWVAFRERVEELHGELDALDYYQLLGIAPSATLSEIKDAFFARSMAYHPDRFMRLEDAELRSAIYEVYKRVSEGFKVLIRPEARSDYDHGLALPDRARHLRYQERPRQPTGSEATSGALTSEGKRYLQFAQLAEQEGNVKSARMYLALAVQCEPQNLALRERLEALGR